MVVLIESVVGIFLFTIIIVLVTLKDPIASVGDYPPAIRKKCMELGLVEERKKRFTKGDIVRKTAAMLVFIAALSWTLKCFNGMGRITGIGCLTRYFIWQEAFSP